jgi:hypothetical protein
MAIPRTPIIDDDGTGTTGTVIDNAWKTELYDQIDTVSGGTWQTVPFNAGNYAAAPAMIWTVTAGNQVTNRYTRLGKTLHWLVGITGSTLSGTATGRIAISLPVTGPAIASTMLGGTGFGLIGGAWQPIMIQLTAGTFAIDIFTQNAGVFTLGTLYIQFGLTFELT